MPITHRYGAGALESLATGVTTRPLLSTVDAAGAVTAPAVVIAAQATADAATAAAAASITTAASDATTKASAAQAAAIAAAAAMVDDLSGVTNAGAARTALGLGTLATKNVAGAVPDPAGVLLTDALTTLSALLVSLRAAGIVAP